MIELELLSPAKNCECGIAAVNSGADAIYIGAHKFGARYNAGNEFSEIQKLISYSHLFRVKVYITINTILFDNELKEVEKIINDLYEIGADAIIIQDFGILEMKLPPVPLIASTQMHNCSADRIKFLEDAGFQRVILARELSLDQIAAIRKKTKIELEFFVHGSLCVSYSGQCYMSQAITGRSSNRGMCSQPCRMTYDLVDSNNNLLAKDKYLLSLKDLNLSEYLNDLINAGITSFKIEGRLKEVNYVSNITSYYRKKIDELINSNDNYKKSSAGKIFYGFESDPKKSFNRGFTNYFINGRTDIISSPETEKSIGEKIGVVKKVTDKYFVLTDVNDLHNGDGICFFDKNGELFGTNVNIIDNEKIFPQNISKIEKGIIIYRNFDLKFEKKIKNTPNVRKMNLEMEFGEIEQGFYLSGKTEDEIKCRYEINISKEPATNKSISDENIKKQLSSLGNSIYVLKNLLIVLGNSYFIPVKTINEMRRKFIEKLDKERLNTYKRKTINIIPNDISFPASELDYRANVSNKNASAFMERHSSVVREWSIESTGDYSGRELMRTKLCLKYEFKLCPKYNLDKNIKVKTPLYLINNKKKYKLGFDCDNCEMVVSL